MTKAGIRKYLDGHVGDLILWSFAVLCLIAYFSAVMVGKPDQTLGNALIGSVGALGAFMTKRYGGQPSTTNVDTANVQVNPPADNAPPTPPADIDPSEQKEAA